MAQFRTHGEFSWSELTTADPEAAKAFYSEVFDWTLEEIPLEGRDAAATYSVVKVGDRGIGGIMSLPSDAEPGVAPTWHSYVTVEDVDRVADRVRLNGGAICAGPREIPGVGRLLVFTDPQGATLCAIEYIGALEEARVG